MIFLFYINLGISVFIELYPELCSHEYIVGKYTQETVNNMNNLQLFWENDKGLNYSDYLVNKQNVQSDDIFNGLCGKVKMSYIMNETYAITNLTYYQGCNVSHDTFWNYNIHSLCNISNKICEYKNVNDIFNIHKRYFKIIDIKPDVFLYEEIAYIQSEIWVLFIIFILVFIFGIHNYISTESGSIKS
mgnify:CR=1 FL=1